MARTLKLPLADGSGNVTDEQKRDFITKLFEDVQTVYAEQAKSRQVDIVKQINKLNEGFVRMALELKRDRDMATDEGNEENVAAINNQLREVELQYKEAYQKYRDNIDKENKPYDVVDKFFADLAK